MPASKSDLVFLSDQLEDGGLIGLAAVGMLTPFLLNDNPGASQQTAGGFVWTERMGAPPGELRLDFLGATELVVSGGSYTATIGVQTTSPFEALLLFELGGNSIFLEVDEDVVRLAPKITRRDLDPSVSSAVADQVVGYREQYQKLRVPLPALRVEFRFTQGDGGLISSVDLAFDDALLDSAIVEVLQGVVTLNMDQVLVIPSAAGMGLFVDQLFIDFSEFNAPTLANVDPEVYNPSWKGMGAENLTFLFPVDFDESDGTNEFIHFGVNGFLLDFEGRLTGDFSGGYLASQSVDPLHPETGPAVTEVSLGLHIRENEVISGDGAVTVNMSRLMGRIFDNSSVPADSAVTGRTRQINDASANQLQSARQQVDFPEVYLRVRVGATYYSRNGRELLGIELSFEGIANRNGEPIDVLPALAGKILFWAAGLGGAGYLIYDFVKNDEGGSLGLGILLIALVGTDMFTFHSRADTLPTLDNLQVSQLGLRLIYQLPGDQPEDARLISEVFCAIRVRLGLDCVLMDALDSLTSVLLGATPQSTDLFGHSLSDFHLKGAIELEISDLTIVRRAGTEGLLDELFDRRETRFVARELPRIEMVTSAASNGADTPVLITDFEFVSKDGDPDNWLGLAFTLSGFGNSQLTVNTPAVGLAVYFFPEVRVEFITQLAQKPALQIVVPPFLLIKGQFDINQPLPSFEGTQSRVDVDVGILLTGADVSSDNLEPQFDISNYAYQFGGTFAWGTAHSEADPNHPRDYDFHFVEIHFEGTKPLFTVGLAGLYGFTLLGGSNIAPGNTGHENSALGILEWLTSNGKDQVFNTLRTWPASPTSQSWHPNLHFENGGYQDTFMLGGHVQFKSEPGGKLFVIDVGAIGGTPEFFAFAGYIDIKPIGANALLVMVYDRGTFVLRFVFEITIPSRSDWAVVRIRASLEVGSMPGRTWVYLGHYDPAILDPLTVELFDGWTTVKGFLVHDTEDMEDFGIAPIDEFSTPDLPGPIWGIGIVWALGPATYGPSFLNVQIFAGIGANVAWFEDNEDEICFYGELFAGGYIRIKIFFFKFSFELLAQLAGMTNASGCRFAGEIRIKIGLPWPFPDIKVSADFVCQTNGFLQQIPGVNFSPSLQAQGRLEARSFDEPDKTPIPIDSVVSVHFESPIETILTNQSLGAATTGLVINDLHPGGEGLIQEYRTEFMNEEYRIALRHVLEHFRITHSGGQTVMDTIPASWDVPPGFDENGVPLTNDTHRVLFLNAWLPTDLQFQGERLNPFIVWARTTEHPPVCQKEFEWRLSAADPSPEIIDSLLTTDTSFGEVTIEGRAQSLGFEPLFRSHNIGDFVTLGDPLPLQLPRTTLFKLPDVTEARLDLTFQPWEKTRILFEEAGRNLGTMASQRIRFRIKLVRLNTIPTFDLTLSLRQPSPGECGYRLVLRPLAGTTTPDFLRAEVDVQQCTQWQVDFRITLESADVFHPIERVEMIGHETLYHSNFVNEFNSVTSGDSDFLSLVTSFRTFQPTLNELFLRRFFAERAPWEEYEAAVKEVGKPEATADQIWDSFLFQPDNEYQVHYSVRTFANIYHVNGDEEKLVEERTLVSTTDPGLYGGQGIAADDLRSQTTPIFKTESVPSQTIEKYVGPVIPYLTGDEDVRWYPGHLSPVLGLRYRGLIRRIYERYPSLGSVAMAVTDINGERIQPVNTVNVQTDSGLLDFTMDSLTDSCLPESADLVGVEISLWERNLKTDASYAVELFLDLQLPQTLFPQSFTTSRYQDIASHIQKVQEALDAAQQSPVTDRDQVENRLRGLIGQGERDFDDLVEEIYRQLAGQEGGWLRPSGDLDSASFLVSRSETDELQTWGLSLELREPFLNKSGVNLPNLVSLSTLEPRGVLFLDSGILIVRDRSGGRVLFFHSTDGINFSPFDSDFDLNVELNERRTLEVGAEQYLATYFPNLELPRWQTQRQQLVDGIVSASSNQQFPIVQAQLRVEIPDG